MRNLYQATATASKLNRGFTLIELLVVVAIIAILAAIAIPQFNKYRRNTAVSGVLSDAKNCLNQTVAEYTVWLQQGGTGTFTAPDCQESANTNSCTADQDSDGKWTVECTGKNIADGVTCTASEGGTASCNGI